MSSPVPTLELLSVHVPKCGGTSLGNAFRRIYGAALLEEYGDRPGDPASPMNQDRAEFLRRSRETMDVTLKNKRAVHGHIHARKYEGAKIGFRTAIIREPISRLLSHYYYWKTCRPEGHRLHAYFLEQSLDLESFARLPLIRAFYTETFFGGLQLDDFDYIGSLESMPATIAAISRGIGHSLDVGFDNKGDSQAYVQGLADLRNTPALHRRLEELLADDIRFYDSVRSRWA